MIKIFTQNHVIVMGFRPFNGMFTKQCSREAASSLLGHLPSWLQIRLFLLTNAVDCHTHFVYWGLQKCVQRAGMRHCLDVLIHVSQSVCLNLFISRTSTFSCSVHSLIHGAFYRVQCVNNIIVHFNLGYAGYMNFV